MKEVNLYSLDGDIIGKVRLPEQFNEVVRKDVIKRAFLALMSHTRQPYGTNPLAGKRHVVRLKRVRRNSYRAVAGRGFAYKVPRKVMYRFGGGWGHVILVGAFAPNTRGGRRAHPPKVEKIWWEKINKKERRLAIRSALAATSIKDFVVGRGHRIKDEITLPIVLEDSMEDVSKTKDVVRILRNLGLEEELDRCYEGEKKWRSGKGKRRGRRYVRKIGPLFVVSSNESPLIKAARNIPGVDVKQVCNLSIRDLAPGGQPGRLTIFSKKALEELENKKLFM